MPVRTRPETQPVMIYKKRVKDFMECVAKSLESIQNEVKAMQNALKQWILGKQGQMQTRQQGQQQK